MATEADWDAYDRAVIDLAPPGRPALRLVPDRRGATGPWPEGIDAPVVIVTAWNPDSRVRSEAVNRVAHGDLAAELGRRGVPHWPATGRDPELEHHEEGVALPGMAEAEGVALGRSYGQAAVYVWTPAAWEVVSCTDGRRRVHGWRTVVTGHREAAPGDDDGPLIRRRG